MDQNLTPKKSHAEFPSHKHVQKQPRPQGFSLKKWVAPHPFFKGKALGTRLVQKALNDKTRILEVGEGRWGMGIKFVLVFPIYKYIACEEIMTSTYMSLNEYFSTFK